MSHADAKWIFDTCFKHSVTPCVCYRACFLLKHCTQSKRYASVLERFKNAFKETYDVGAPPHVVQALWIACKFESLNVADLSIASVLEQHCGFLKAVSKKDRSSAILKLEFALFGSIGWTGLPLSSPYLLLYEYSNEKNVDMNTALFAGWLVRLHTTNTMEQRHARWTDARVLSNAALYASEIVSKAPHAFEVDQQTEALAYELLLQDAAYVAAPEDARGGNSGSPVSVLEDGRRFRKRRRDSRTRALDEFASKGVRE